MIKKNSVNNAEPFLIKKFVYYFLGYGVGPMYPSDSAKVSP